MVRTLKLNFWNAITIQTCTPYIYYILNEWNVLIYEAAPQRMVLPRLPARVILNGKYQMIPEDKIVGGTEVVPNSLPFQISLQRRSFAGFSQSCGGSILNENTILDAAHCVDGYVGFIKFFIWFSEARLKLSSRLL